MIEKNDAFISLVKDWNVLIVDETINQYEKLASITNHLKVC